MIVNRRCHLWMAFVRRTRTHTALGFGTGYGGGGGGGGDWWPRRPSGRWRRADKASVSPQTCTDRVLWSRKLFSTVSSYRSRSDRISISFSNMNSATAVLLACAVTIVTGSGNLQVVNEWTLLQYDVPFNYPNADSYKPEVTISTGIEIG